MSAPATAPDVVISVENLGKKFCRSLRRSMLYATLDILRAVMGIKYDKMKLRSGEFLATDGLSFELRRGEALGIIGRNGSGKTTLLRLLSGIYPPDQGRITVRGRVGALIAVGAGFHPHMSGRENIYLNGAILGMKRREIDERLQDIVAFADIGEFIDAPVSTYSSGMTVRLGFAVAIQTQPDVLLIDEILAVGDVNFQQKCMAKISELQAAGTSIILISHQMLNIQKVCQRAILLDHGRVICDGDVGETIAAYYSQSADTTDLRAERPKSLIQEGIACRNLEFRNGRGEQTRSFAVGDDIVAEMSFTLPQPLQNVAVHLSLGNGPYTYNGYVTAFDDVRIPELRDGDTIRLTIKKAALSPGDYIVSIGLWDERFVGSYFWDYETPGIISVRPTKKIQGRFEFEHTWEIGPPQREE